MGEEPYERKFLCESGEYVEAYTPGGFHPLLIGDELKDGRYKIIHKLGNGGSATVWLARDTHEDRYVAIKVFQAWASKFAKEVGIHHHLSKDPDFAYAPIAKIRNHFTVRGINGRHVCLVLDVHGPNLGDLCQIKFRPDDARDITRQIAEAINLLHRNDVAFGDLCPSNILLGCVNFDSFSTEALYKVLGEPEPERVVCLAKDKSVAKHAPEWMYDAVNLFGRSRDLGLLKPRVVLADLNEAEHVTSPATESRTGYHSGYTSPEFTFGITRRHTKPSDIWVLALIFYEIRCQASMAYGLHGLDKGVSIQKLIGPPPPDFYETAKKTTEKKLSDTDDLYCITEEEFASSEITIKNALQAVGNWEPWHTMNRDERRAYIEAYMASEPNITVHNVESKLDTGAPPPASLSDEEFTDFYDLLSKMLLWNPEERLTIEQVLAHPWLNRKYNDLDQPSEHWIERYNTGQTSWEKSNYDTNYWNEVFGEDAYGNPWPPKVAVEESGDVDKEDEYFVTRLLGLPVPKEEEAEETEVIPAQDSKVQPEVVGKEEDLSDNDEYFVTRLLGLPVPSSGNASDVVIVAIQDSKVQQDLEKVDEDSSDNDEYFVTRLLGLSVSKQEEIKELEVTSTQNSKEQLETVKEEPEAVKQEGESTYADEFFVTRLLGLPVPTQEDVEDAEPIATGHSLGSIDDLEQLRTPGHDDEYFVTHLLGLPVPKQEDDQGFELTAMDWALPRPLRRKCQTQYTAGASGASTQGHTLGTKGERSLQAILLSLKWWQECASSLASGLNERW